MNVCTELESRAILAGVLQSHRLTSFGCSPLPPFPLRRSGAAMPPPAPATAGSRLPVGHRRPRGRRAARHHLTHLQPMVSGCCTALLLLACASARVSGAEGTATRLCTGAFCVEADTNATQLTVWPKANGTAHPPTSTSPLPLWESAWESASSSASGPFLRYAVRRWTAKEDQGMFVVDDKTVCGSDGQSLTALTAATTPDGCITASGSLTTSQALPPECPTAVPYTIELCPESDHRLSMTAAVNAPPPPGGMVLGLTLSSAAEADERFFGFGEQYTFLNMRGRVVPILSSEQGVGRGREPLTFILNSVDHSGGNWHTTYAPVPHFISSSLRSFYLSNTEPSVFDVGATVPSALAVTVLSATLQGHIVAADSPLGHVEAYTEFSGRLRPLPAWATQGAIIGYEGGTDAVLALHAKVKAAKVRTAGYWVQDWSGLRLDGLKNKRLWWNWEVDDEHYHDWDALLGNLSADGTRILTYINPYLATNVSTEKPNFKTDFFKEAEALGYLLKDQSGAPYLQYSVTKSFGFGTVNLLDPAAAAWYRDVIRHEMLDRGISGWMSDFGEYLPFDAQLADPMAAHNNFPFLWTQTNAQAVHNYLGTSGVEPIYFSRSGAAKSPGVGSLFWAGDQLTVWDSYDGLATALKSALSAGLSGFGLIHSDIGGYTMVDEFGVRITRSQTLLLRWMELSAIADVVFRTHPGTLPEKSVQVYDSPQLLACFGRMAELHHALSAYKQGLMNETAALGYPLVRHTWLHYPSDPNTLDLDEQYLLGPDVLAAPVLDKAATTVHVYLPAGAWTHFWSLQNYTSTGQTYTVPAPIGEPVLMVRQGSPLLGALARARPAIGAFQCSLSRN